MKKIIHTAGTRGHANHGWLDTYYSFSFASWQNPERVRFGVLRVLNDDIIAPDMGFGMHPHDNMEIITIILRGELKHKDSMGSEGIIKENEIQVMSAGRGVTHSEFNPSKSEEVNLLQIWVFPDKKDIEPRYDQQSFAPEGKENKLLTLISPDKDSKESMRINQGAYFSIGKFDAGKEISYEVHTERNGVYVFVIEGEIEIDGDKLGRRDAMGIWETGKFDMKVLSDNSEVLLIEVPMN